MPTSFSIQAPTAYRGVNDAGGKEKDSSPSFCTCEQTAFMIFTTNDKDSIKWFKGSFLKYFFHVPFFPPQMER